MLKTNSKKAAENIRAYIVDNFTPENYTDNPPQEWPKIAAFILNTFRNEKYHLPEDTETGTLYAIIGRCSNLFILF